MHVPDWLRASAQSVPRGISVTVWDPRRRCLYLLAIPSAKDPGDLHYQTRLAGDSYTSASKQRDNRLTMLP